jgi:carboxyl-terminal processing protease
MKFRYLKATMIVVFLFSAGLMSGALTGRLALAEVRNPYVALESFARVLTTIESDYVDERPEEQLLSAAINGMLDELDPHSRWLSKEAYERLTQQTDGEVVGIGIEFQPATQGAIILRMLPNSPATNQGLMVGDIILAIGGSPLSGQTHSAIAAQLNGKVGTKVDLTVLRSNQQTPTEVQVTRADIHVQPIETDWLPGAIAYARIIQFQRGSAQELERQLQELETLRPMKALILDVRDNPGGLLEEAVAVADLFLDEGMIVTTQGRIEGRIEYSATPGGLPPELPVVLLVNQRSASGSEVLSGALQDTKRATLIGNPTYGKGSVQTLYENADGSALKLTIAHYFTPSGQPVAPSNGRSPDIVIENAPGASPKKVTIELVEDAELSEKDRTSIVAWLERLPTSKAESALIEWHQPAHLRGNGDRALKRALTFLAAEASPSD